MSNQLQGRRIAILAADGVEKVELEQPRAVLEQVGAEVHLLSLKSGEIQARNHDLEPAGTLTVGIRISDGCADVGEMVARRWSCQGTTDSHRQRSVCRREGGFDRDRCAGHACGYPRHWRANGADGIALVWGTWIARRHQAARFTQAFVPGESRAGTVRDGAKSDEPRFQ
jgi:putative intracellular protease/amidase